MVKRKKDFFSNLEARDKGLIKNAVALEKKEEYKTEGSYQTRKKKARA